MNDPLANYTTRLSLECRKRRGMEELEHIRRRPMMVVFGTLSFLGGTVVTSGRDGAEWQCS